MNVLFTLKNKMQIMLRSDESNFELCRIRNRIEGETGEQSVEWEPFKWFASLDQALNRLIDMQLRVSDAQSIEELKRDLIAARQAVSTEWGSAMSKISKV